ncbi:SDR family NAD(P)-dependent oxidoreductase [Peristeroidobacter soli]|uniref:SDR family NAD(P)-dependent oxidoreductase n=1 Tax=Peristeroidobacter soli TaxID=2497877 RepID=UPI001C37AF09|nr:SDR family oxidoreductase [Peristeroidobacter soli]
MKVKSMTYADSNHVPDYLRLLRLDRRGYIVLGAGDGMGRQAAHALAQAGARILCVDRDSTLAEKIAAETDGVAATGDVTSRSEMERIFALARDQLDAPLAGIVDVVGMAITKPLAQLDDAGWTAQFDVVLRHAYLALQLGSRALPGGGCITFVGSISGEVSVANQAAYGTAKAALHHLVRCAAHELGPSGIRVNAVAPGFVRTPRLLKALSSEFWDRVSSANPLRRVAVPADIAAALLYLSSDLAGYVTGNVLTLDGGTSSVAALPDFTVPTLGK